MNRSAGNFDHATVYICAAANTGTIRHTCGRYFALGNINNDRAAFLRIKAADRAAGTDARTAASQTVRLSIAALCRDHTAANINDAIRRFNDTAALCTGPAAANASASASIALAGCASNC